MLLAAAAGSATPEPARREALQLAQLTIEQRIIIRIPIVPQTGAPPPTGGRSNAGLTQAPPPVPPEQDQQFREVKGPKCLKLKKIRGAIISLANGVTMVGEGDDRFRPHFGRMCQPAGFYQGFYIEPNKDGQICAGRDSFHARNGSICEVERFSKLVPDGDD